MKTKESMEPEKYRGLGRLSTLVKGLIHAKIAVEDAEQLLKDCKETLREFEETRIPDVMAELGLSEIILDTGDRISITKEYYAKIPEMKIEEAFNWLKNHGLGSVIKNVISSTFGKGEGEYAEKLKEFLADQKMGCKEKKSVHHQTLKALVKERYEAGEDIPEELFGIHVKNVTKITK
tara:strand:+ start:994 stop:1527 length:534 start_codon:yes stop_codon:yes gene_type:complete